MQNWIAIVIFVVLLLLLSVLPGFERNAELEQQAPRAPVVSLERGL